ncbi:MAG: hypothetical protein L6R40_004715 [Gallowayella cf. fulva]|nr:MAG: hypothetical protein L6R40_004715 [Xanthomendoza cf. fulva]
MSLHSVVSSKKGPRPDQLDIFAAVLTGQVDLIASCIDQGCDVNEVGYDGYTPLCTAIRNGEIEAARFLIQRASILERRRPPSRSRRLVALVQLFFTGKSERALGNQNASSMFERLVVFIGYLVTHLALNALLTGIDIRVMSLLRIENFGVYSTIRTTICRQYLSSLLSLINRRRTNSKEKALVLNRGGANLTMQGYAALDLLLNYAGKVEAIALQLLAEGLVFDDINDPRGPGIRMWEWAAFHGHLQTIVTLQAMGIGVHGNSARALHTACYNLDVNLVKHLLHSGASSALQTTGLVECAEGARNVRNRRPHHMVDALAIMQELISQGEGINQLGRHGRTALSYCSCSSLQGLMTFLLQKGANPNLADNDGSTPLHHVAWEVNPLPLTKMLLVAGASSEVRNHKGDTPMDSAARDGSCLENLKRLIESSRPTQLDWDTMLYEASLCGFLEMLEYLMHNGANPTVEIRNNNCALSQVMWRSQDSEKAMAMLLKHPASRTIATKSSHALSRRAEETTIHGCWPVY